MSRNRKKLTVVVKDGKPGLVMDCMTANMDHPGWMRVTIAPDAHGHDNVQMWVRVNQDDIQCVTLEDVS